MSLQISNEEYHARPELSSSDLKSILKNYNYWLYSKANRQEKDCFEFGTAYHTYILEQEKFFQENHILEDVNLSKNESLIKAISSLDVAFNCEGMKNNELKATYNDLLSFLRIVIITSILWILPTSYKTYLK